MKIKKRYYVLLAVSVVLGLVVAWIAYGNTDLDISDLQIPFLDMNSFLYYTKKFLNNHSHFYKC